MAIAKGTLATSAPPHPWPAPVRTRLSRRTNNAYSGATAYTIALRASDRRDMCDLAFELSGRVAVRSSEGLGLSSRE